MPKAPPEDPEAAWRSVARIFTAFRSRVDSEAQDMLRRYEIDLTEVRGRQDEEARTKVDPTSDR